MADNGQTATTTAMPVTTTDTGDTAWMLTCAALVLLMTPALGFFYGGLVNKKNILNQIFLSFICMGIVLVQWVLFGFSFAFGPPVSAGFGSFGYGALNFGTRSDPIYTPTYPLLAYAIYQGTFAVITSALISGSVVGRMKVVPYIIFVCIWTTVCYDPMAHWVWAANGWLRSYGILDFAGGTVVHILSGVSGFVASMILGRRIDYHEEKIKNQNIPFTVLGAALLWVGWTGFNGGSANSADPVAALAVVNTHAAAAAGLVTWTVIDAIRGHLSVSGSCTGPIIGLVAITPAAGFVAPGWALLFGILPTMIIYGIIIFKRFIRVDDTLDVAVVHGVGGCIGGFMTGLFANIDLNPGGANGAFYGEPFQMWRQLAGILTAIGFGSACTALILFPLNWLIGIRLTPEEELLGLDVIEHGEAWGITVSPLRGNDLPGGGSRSQAGALNTNAPLRPGERSRRPRNLSNSRRGRRARLDFSRTRPVHPRTYVRGFPIADKV